MLFLSLLPIALAAFSATAAAASPRSLGYSPPAISFDPPAGSRLPVSEPVDFSFSVDFGGTPEVLEFSIGYNGQNITSTFLAWLDSGFAQLVFNGAVGTVTIPGVSFPAGQHKVGIYIVSPGGGTYAEWSANAVAEYPLSSDQESLIATSGNPEYFTISFNPDSGVRQESWTYAAAGQQYTFWEGARVQEETIALDQTRYSNPSALDPALFTSETSLADITALFGTDYLLEDASSGDFIFKTYFYPAQGFSVSFLGDQLVVVRALDIISSTTSSLTTLSRYRGFNTHRQPGGAAAFERQLRSFRSEGSSLPNLLDLLSFIGNLVPGPVKELITSSNEYNRIHRDAIDIAADPNSHPDSELNGAGEEFQQMFRGAVETGNTVGGENVIGGQGLEAGFEAHDALNRNRSGLIIAFVPTPSNLVAGQTLSTSVTVTIADAKLQTVGSKVTYTITGTDGRTQSSSEYTDSHGQVTFDFSVSGTAGYVYTITILAEPNSASYPTTTKTFTMKVQEGPPPPAPTPAGEYSGSFSGSGTFSKTFIRAGTTCTYDYAFSGGMQLIGVTDQGGGDFTGIARLWGTLVKTYVSGGTSSFHCTSFSTMDFDKVEEISGTAPAIAWSTSFDTSGSGYENALVDFSGTFQTNSVTGNMQIETEATDPSYFTSAGSVSIPVSLSRE